MNDETKPKREYTINHASGFFYPNGLQVDWSASNIGWGAFNFGFNKEMGRMVCDSEMMSREFVIKALTKLVEETIFLDFEDYSKVATPISLADADKLMNFQDHIFYQSFYHEVDKDNPSFMQMRWRIADEQVLNVWFDKSVVEGNGDDDAILSFEMRISKKKTFKKGFMKAEVWSWNKTEKAY